MGVSLPKKMTVGTVYDAFCFLDAPKKKAFYILLPSGQTAVDKCVLHVIANYNWDNVPDDGQTLTSQDVQVLQTGPVKQMLSFATSDGTDIAKPGKLLDLSQLAPLTG